jgi:hypothetical protein
MPKKDADEAEFVIPVEPILTLAKVEFRDGSIAVVAVTTKADRAVLQSCALGYKELSSADVKKLPASSKGFPIWTYGSSSAEKLKDAEHITIDDIKKQRISTTREKKELSDEDDDS